VSERRSQGKPHPYGTDFSEGIRTIQRGDKEKLQCGQVRIERDAGNAIINLQPIPDFLKTDY